MPPMEKMLGAMNWAISRRSVSPKLLLELLAPCSQFIVISALHGAFVLLFVLLLLSKLGKTAAARRTKALAAGPLFIATLLISALATTGYITLEATTIWMWTRSKAGLFCNADIVFISLQTLKWFIYLSTLAHLKKFGAASHPWPLRSWWFADFLLSCCLAALAFGRVYARETSISELFIIDISSLAALPISLFFFILGIAGKTGIRVEEGENLILQQPLLDGGDAGHSSTGYERAGLLSRATWTWLNPLLQKGYRAPLSVDDVPELAVQDRAESSCSRFEDAWSSQASRAELPSVRSTLLQCYRGKLLLNGTLAFIRLCVMYAGPIMIQKFVDYTAQPNRSVLEGYGLVLTLLVAKCVEVLAAHQYNFQSQRLGMLVRSSIITSVYRKGLRLSSSSKQGHGVGEIVNYMVVDAQQLSDLMLQLHNTWILPGQVCIALTILYSDVGLPMLAGFAVMVMATAFNFYSTKKQRHFQALLMKLRDARMKATNEVLNFMKVIKFQAWEDHFQKRIEAARNAEFGALSSFVTALGQNIVMLWMCPSLVATTTFTACVLFSSERLTPGTVFTATATFRILQEPIRAFPQTLISISQALVSFERLEKFMACEELDPEAVEYVTSDSDSVVTIEHASFSWDDSTVEPTLKDVTFDVKKGQLVTIVGAVGSGKSSLLTAVLGEMRKLHGKVTISGTTAYVPQTAWIQNATIEENILFGQPMDKSRYKAVVKACALETDFKIMEFGDQTEIGERGINLSGGQKQRIQLARAVYQDCDIYLLDDVFSAVDAHTGTQLFQECVMGALFNKTVLLVTHQVEFLHGADLILVMRDGAVVQSGKYGELLQEGTDLEALVAAHNSAMDSINIDDDGGEEHVLTEDISLEVEASKAALSCSPSMQRTCSQTRTPFSRPQPSKGEYAKKATSKLIDEEQRASGRVGWDVYKLYVTKATGWVAPLLVLFAQGSWTVLNTLSDYWLAHETSKPKFRASLFITVYFLLSLACWLFIAMRTVVSLATGLKTAQLFFFDMLRSIFRTTMAFFDTTPSGRILSRASTDQTQLDILLPFFSGGAVASVLGAACILVVTCQVTWPVIFLVVPLLCAFVWYQGYFITTSRELTRLDSITKAPVIFQFSETLAGITTIRAFKKQKTFAELNVDRVNTNIRMDFHNNAANEWLGVRLEMMGTTLLCTSALLMITVSSNVVKPELVGLSLSYGLALNTSLFWSVWLLCMIENKMVSVERIRQYTVIESEAPRIIESCRPPDSWPSEGEISIRELQFRYRPNTPLVLKGLTLTIAGGHKVGVVGRTGSGKSTLIQAFFRLVEPCGGQILVDGLEITKLGLADLRSRFGIIPQEPILFQGSIRSNVDPLGQYSDAQIWEVLRKCQLTNAVQQKAGGLDSEVLDSGDNWSVGQKQLFCLGRAMLKESRVLFLDEATASVDAQTDLIIQRTIKDQFAKSTVVSVAHRIPSVMDSDKVLVMAEGEVKEYERPSLLLEQPASLFAALVREYATRSGGE